MYVLNSTVNASKKMSQKPVNSGSLYNRRKNRRRVLRNIEIRISFYEFTKYQGDLVLERRERLLQQENQEVFV